MSVLTQLAIAWGALAFIAIVPLLIVALVEVFDQ